MFSGDEETPSEAVFTTNYELCVYCQSQSKEALVDTSHANFKQNSYEHLINIINKRAELGNSKFLSASKRLKDINAKYLSEKKASWHSSCYKSITNKAHISRDEQNYKKQCNAGKTQISSNRKGYEETYSTALNSSSGTAISTRAQLGKFHKEKFFFCQEDTDQILHPCLSPNRGKNITEIVQNSSNDKWKTNLAEVISCGDLLSRDFVYHHLCYTRNWKKYIQKKNTVEKDKASSEPVHKEIMKN